MEHIYSNRGVIKMSVNKAIIVGRLGRDPELKQLSSGNTVANMNVATSEKWTDKSGSKNESTEWHRIVVFGKKAEVCGKFLSKGSQVYIEGRLQTRSWEDKQGAKQYTTEIVANQITFLDSKGEAKQDSNYVDWTDPKNAFGDVPNMASEEELPF